jgi:hypothetical protein
LTLTATAANHTMRAVGIGEGHMRSAKLGVLVSVVAAPAMAAPLATITCEAPKGVSSYYGVLEIERAMAAGAHKAAPTNHLGGPEKDGYSMRLTFLLDSSRKRLTRIWVETDADRKQREGGAKALGVAVPDPPAAIDLPVLAYSPDAITAALTDSNGSILYSLYPKLGMMFMSAQLLEVDGQLARQNAMFAKCEFAWSGKP